MERWMDRWMTGKIAARMDGPVCKNTSDGGGCAAAAAQNYGGRYVVDRAFKFAVPNNHDSQAYSN